MGITSDYVLLVKPRISDQQTYDTLDRKIKLSQQPRRDIDLLSTRAREDLEAQKEALVVTGPALVSA